MRKQLFIAALLLSGTQLAGAQEMPRKANSGKFNVFQAGILKQQHHPATAKPAADAPQRLIAVAAYVGDALNDSAFYNYGGGRFSDLSNLDMGAYQDNFIPTSPLNPVEEGSMTNNYLAYDTMRYFVRTPGGILPAALAVKTYDGSDRMVYSDIVNYTVTGAAAARRRFYVAYQGSGNDILKSIALVDTSTAVTGMFDTAQVLRVQYNTAGQRVLDSSAYPIDADLEQVAYTYTPSGKLASVTFSYSDDGGASFTPDSRSTYTYDESGRLVETLEEAFDGAAWTPGYLDSFSYTGTRALYTTNKGFGYGGGWQPDYRLDGVLMPDFDAFESFVVRQDEGSGLEPVLKVTFEYNAMKHRTLMAYYITEGTGIPEDPTLEIKYYYEVAASVPAVAASVPAVSLYPNPATTHINVSGEGQTRVSVYSLSGQVVLQQHGVAHAGKLMLPVGSLPAGTYVADVQSANGRAQVTFVKQ